MSVLIFDGRAAVSSDSCENSAVTEQPVIEAFQPTNAHAIEWREQEKKNGRVTMTRLEI